MITKSVNIINLEYFMCKYFTMHSNTKIGTFQGLKYLTFRGINFARLVDTLVLVCSAVSFKLSHLFLPNFLGMQKYTYSSQQQQYQHLLQQLHLQLEQQKHFLHLWSSHGCWQTEEHGKRELKNKYIYFIHYLLNKYKLARHQREMKQQLIYFAYILPFIN